LYYIYNPYTGDPTQAFIDLFVLITNMGFPSLLVFPLSCYTCNKFFSNTTLVSKEIYTIDQKLICYFIFNHKSPFQLSHFSTQLVHFWPEIRGEEQSEIFRV